MFFDVRSQQGDTLTTAGDVCYDLAKVLQSLQGYDHVILADDEIIAKAAAEGPQSGLSMLLKPEDRAFLAGLQDCFWNFVRENYGSAVEPHDLLVLVASLLFTLIPLHRPAVQPLFLQMCANILEHDSACPV